MDQKKKTNIIWLALILFSVIGGIVFSLIFLVPFEYQKSWVDALAADGEVESYTLRIYSFEKYCAGLLAVLFTVIAVFLLGFRDRAKFGIEAFRSSIRAFIFRMRREIREIALSIKPSKSDLGPLIILFGIIALGTFFRYAYLWRPMGHDETYTFMAFASRGLRYSVTDYHLPNNHVFHTILVNLAFQLFGDSPAIIRLPAFLAGILIIPATYLVGKQFFNTNIALVSASIVASLPVLIDYSTTARGYTILTLFTLIIVALAVYVKDHKNLLAWGFLVIISSLGLYTNPTMIYPIGMVLTWLLLSRLIKDIDNDYDIDYFFYLGSSSVLIIAFTGVLYTPIILNSGIQPLVSNDVIEALSWSDFYQSIPVRIKNTWAEWNRNLPGWVSITAIIGLVASLFVPRQPKKRRAPLILAGILWIGTVLVIQRVAPWPRIWLFLLPLIVIWISAGIVGLIGLILTRMPRRDYLMIGVVGLLVILPLLASFLSSYTQYSQKLHARGELEKVATYLSDYLQPEDVVVVTSPDTIVLKYYLRRYGVAQEATELTKDKPFDHAIVVVNKAYDQNLEYVLDRRSFLDDISLESAEEIFSSKRFAIYQLSGD
jgi:hypothetical protein